MHIKPNKRLPARILTALAGLLIASAAQAGRALVPEDWYRFKALSDLQISSDGASAAYLVTSYDKESDESRAALWQTDWKGGDSVQLTRGESVGNPRFSPDGRYISFLMARPSGATTQLWVLERRGGEARLLSHVEGDVVAYEWAPDGSHAVLVVRPSTHEGADPGTNAGKSPRPIVVDSLHFKKDTEGYLTSERRPHLYLLDTRTGGAEALTRDPARADSLPVFSPDSRRIAFISSPVDDPHAAGRSDIYLIDAAVGSTPRRLVSTEAPTNQSLQWSPDGSRIAFLRGAELKYNAYSCDELVVADMKSGKTRALTEGLDRAVLSPKFASDGRSILFLVADDGLQYPAQVSLETGSIVRLGERMVVHELAAAQDHVAVLASGDSAPTEAFALEAGHLRPLSSHNTGLFNEVTLGRVEDVKFKSADGTEVHGLLVEPPDFVAGRRYPTILWVHGGPNSQDDHSLELWGYGTQIERQFFATHGYVVLAINYRGGTGRGAKYTRAIFADWGHKEVDDLLAGADYAVARGIADPARLGIGGWSYGGILTDYTIAKDTRFKAAISGAGSGNQTAMYGVDQYVFQYNNEVQPPWHDTASWIKLSYPVFHADRIRTPTLFLGGDKDFNVPLQGGEQMYQSLRTLGVPARLVVYPGEYHVLTRPSFLVDRIQRYLDWMDSHLAAGAGAPH